MTNLMKASLSEACYAILMKWCPVDTGALANMIYVNITDDGFELIIPTWYTVYTNEVWIRRKGINPNEAWIQNAFVEIYEYLSKRLNSQYARINQNEYTYIDNVDGLIGNVVERYNKETAPHKSYSNYNSF